MHEFANVMPVHVKAVASVELSTHGIYYDAIWSTTCACLLSNQAAEQSSFPQRCLTEHEPCVSDHHQGLVVLGGHLEPLYWYPLRRCVLSAVQRLCIGLAHHVLLLLAATGKDCHRRVALLLGMHHNCVRFAANT